VKCVLEVLQETGDVTQPGSYIGLPVLCCALLHDISEYGILVFRCYKNLDYVTLCIATPYSQVVIIYFHRYLVLELSVQPLGVYHVVARLKFVKQRQALLRQISYSDFTEEPVASIFFFFFSVLVCAITASGVPGGTLVSMNRFSTLCG
jgi:hypothetical protein